MNPKAVNAFKHRGLAAGLLESDDGKSIQERKAAPEKEAV